MDFATIKKRVALSVRDPERALLADAEYGFFVNDAIDDLRNGGWLQPLEEDETTTMAEDTYEYDVPDGFAYIYALITEDADGDYPASYVIPYHQWRIGLDASTDPEFMFNKVQWAPDNGKTIKVIGQKRPAELSGTDTVVAGMESFIRERAIAYAARAMAQLPAALEARFSTAEAEQSSPPGTRRPPAGEGYEESRSKMLLALSERAWVNSERMFAYHPMEFRVWPSSVYVPGR